jgi:type IV pilus assembly protein PilW
MTGRVFSVAMRRHRGMTLVELMVAMTLSLVLMAGVTTLFQGTKLTRQLQDGMATVQQNGRYALHLLVRDIRGAGYTGCAGMEPTQISIIANSPPGGIAVFDESEVIFGIDNVTSGNAFGARAGTDIVRVRGGDDALVGLVGNTVPVNANIQTTVARDIFEAGDLLLITDCETADLFRATNVSQSSNKTTIAHASSQNTTNFLSKPYDKDAFILGFKSNTYFIRDTGRTNRTGDPIFGLFREDYDGNVVELVDGIDDMQVTYGVDVTGDDVVDRYITAPAAGHALWTDVISVRIALLMNSVDNVNSGAITVSFEGTDYTDQKLRRAMASTVTIRNRVD